MKSKYRTPSHLAPHQNPLTIPEISPPQLHGRIYTYIRTLLSPLLPPPLTLPSHNYRQGPVQQACTHHHPQSDSFPRKTRRPEKREKSQATSKLHNRTEKKKPHRTYPLPLPLFANGGISFSVAGSFRLRSSTIFPFKFLSFPLLPFPFFLLFLILLLPTTTNKRQYDVSDLDLL